MVSRRMFVGSTLAATRLTAADDDSVWWSIKRAGNALRRGERSPVDLTRESLDRIHRLNRTLNAFVTITDDSALQQARVLEREARAGQWRGPVHGIPIAVKDLFDTAAVRTTACSRHWSDRIPGKDAEVVRRLKSAGAIILGKLNMDEFAYNFTGETSLFGTSRNPWNPQRSPGGSSGGSAVAVAAGMCSAALGSDTGGSIRLPAALCGITGYKPTYGITSTEGVAPLAWSLDHVGPMCRSAMDVAILHEALTGRTVRLAAVDVKSLRVGIPRSLFYDDVDAQVHAAITAAAGTMKALMYSVRDVTAPSLRRSKDLPDFPDAYVNIISAEAYAFHEEMLRDHPELYHPGTRKSIESGASISAARYIQARQEMQRLRAGANEFFPDVDLLLTPTAPGPAFAFGAGRLVFLRNAAPWNLLGLPSISIPCGFTDDDLPVGLQITGKAGRDDLVLAAAAAFQRLTEWHLRRPPVA